MRGGWVVLELVWVVVLVVMRMVVVVSLSFGGDGGGGVGRCCGWVCGDEVGVVVMLEDGGDIGCYLWFVRCWW